MYSGSRACHSISLLFSCITQYPLSFPREQNSCVIQEVMSINQFPNCAALGPTLTPGIADLWEQPTTIHTADSCTLSRLGLWHRSWLKPMVYKDGIQECHVQGSGLEEEEVLPGPGECKPQMRLTISECTEHNNQLPNSLRWTEISCSTGWAKKSWGQTVLPQPFSRTPFLMTDLYIHFRVLQSQFFVSA